MKLRQSIRIQAPRDRVWAYIADPARWLAWNDQIVAIRRSRTGPLVAGEVFETTWRLKRRQSETEINVASIEPARNLRLRQYFSHDGRGREIEILFALKETARGTEIIQIIDHRHSGIPVVFQFLMWCLRRFGKPVGLSSLEKFQSILESKPTG